MKALTLAGLALCAGCFVDRPSKAYECQTTADCAAFVDDRQCQGGYCVVARCPEECSACDEEARTCTVECTSAERCGGVRCPSGWDCTVTCIGGGACDDVQCGAGSRCDVTCAGEDACDTVDCSAACKCDVNCVAGACDAPRCPTVGNGANQVECTSDGTQTGPCDSARASGCTKC